jgi:hypothetical protein
VILLLCAALASAAPQIDLYSMGPGDELFSRFGHSAICVENDAKTRCYNYGSTSIEPLRLTVGFVRATALFEVTRTSLDHMLERYAAHDRRVVAAASSRVRRAGERARAAPRARREAREQAVHVRPFSSTTARRESAITSTP